MFPSVSAVDEFSVVMMKRLQGSQGSLMVLRDVVGSMVLATGVFLVAVLKWAVVLEYPGVIGVL